MLGSVLNQVLLHQTVIGLETKTALDKYGEKADIIIETRGEVNKLDFSDMKYGILAFSKVESRIPL